MSASEGYPLQVDYDFAAIAKVHGIYDDTEITALREACLTSDHDSDIAYDQAVLPIIHAYDMANIERTCDWQAHELRGLAFCLADIHYQTGHYSYCLDELKFIEQTLETDNPLRSYIEEAFNGIYSKLPADDPLYMTPVRTDILLS